jgi:hypothetical protein
MTLTFYPGIIQHWKGVKRFGRKKKEGGGETMGKGS